MANLKPASKLIGTVDSEKHKALVSRLDEQRQFLLTQCAQTWQDSVRFMRLWLSQRDDMRKEARDAWMANVFVPEPYKIAETKAAMMLEMLYSVDPPIQPEGVGDEDYEPSKGVDKLLDYGLRKNRFRKLISSLGRMTSVKGTQFFVLGWTDDSREIELGDPTAPDTKEFAKQLGDVFEEMGIQDPTSVPDWMSEPAAFNEWREEARKHGVRVPELPNVKYKVTTYRGPKWELLELTDILLDPLIQEINEQPILMRRMMKRASWLRARSGKDGPYDPNAVEAAITAAGDKELTSEERNINDFLGIPSGKDDPATQDRTDPLCEFWECWQLGSEVEYALLVNRKAIVNRELSLPYKHGANAIGQVRNVIVPGRAFGLSDYVAPESLFKELNIMRSLRINRTILETFPMFTRLMEMGMPELQEQMVPSGIIPVSRPDALKPLIEYRATQAFADMDRMVSEIAAGSGIGSNLSGAPADVNRVSATDASSRLQQAQVRVKLSVVIAEEELVPAVQQMLWLFAERGGPEMQFRVAGQQPFVNVKREELIQALEMDYRFVGATRTLKKDVQVQQLLEALNQNRDRFVPTEQRELLRTVVETLSVKGLGRVLTPAGDKLAQLQVEIAVMQASMEKASLEKQMIALQLPPPPASVSPEVAQQLSGGTGAVQPPGGPPGPLENDASPAGAPALTPPGLEPPQALGAMPPGTPPGPGQPPGV